MNPHSLTNLVYYRFEYIYCVCLGVGERSVRVLHAYIENLLTLENRQINECPHAVAMGWWWEKKGFVPATRSQKIDFVCTRGGSDENLRQSK